MTKRDEEDLGLALVSGTIGALLGRGNADNKIKNLEAEKRQLENEIIMQRNTISALENVNAQLRAENSKLKAEKTKDKPSVKDIAKSLFDKF